MKNIVMGLLVSLMSVSAFANMGYVKGGLGLSFGGEIDGGTSQDLKSGMPFFAAFGYNMGSMFSIEGEISKRSNEIKDSGGADADVLALAVNGVFNYAVDGLPVLPYFGGGLSFGSYEFGNADSEMGVALQFFGGASYAINEQFSVGGDLRYMLTVVDPEIGSTEFSYSHLGVLAHVKYNF